MAATPKKIPCPGSPAAAEPASCLSTSQTLSDSDEPTERSRGLQVKGLRRQVEFPVTDLAAAKREPRGFLRGIINQLAVVIGVGCFRLYLSSIERTECLTRP